TGNRWQRQAGHRPRNHQRARPGGRERRGILQRSRQRADVRRNLVQGQRAVGIARWLQSRRAEKRFGKNRRRPARGCFVCGPWQPVRSILAVPSGWRRLNSSTGSLNVRHLLQPRVLNLAVIAAMASALACHPRLLLWINHPEPVWYLEGMIFLCGIVLWGFVFAWHTQYTGRPVFVLKPEPGPFIAATVVAIIAAALFDLLLDPSLRSKLPEEYPADLEHWFAFLLFTLAINQLFLLFAPFDWLMRL